MNYAVSELAKAEKEGRLVTLPCKIGDIVYRLCGCKGRRYVGERIVNAIILTADTTFINTTVNDALDKTVFLTREEAEVALERQKAK